ncbi:UNVERIFIED_CONTAM: Rho GTPase-activating protein 33 [Trichonephila clavipes]
MALSAPTSQATADAVRTMLTQYLERFSQLAGSLINCGPVLNWLELDNRGNRLIVTDEAAINTPAVAAAYVIKRYASQANDEISLEVGDIISVIDMPPPKESSWWRGKKGFQVTSKKNNKEIDNRLKNLYLEANYTISRKTILT